MPAICDPQTTVNACKLFEKKGKVDGIVTAAPQTDGTTVINVLASSTPVTDANVVAGMSSLRVKDVCGR